MEQIKLLPSHEDTMIGRMLRDLNSLDLIDNKLNSGCLCSLDRENYEQIKTITINELKMVIDHVKINESFYDDILSLYKLSVTIFLVRYFKDYL